MPIFKGLFALCPRLLRTISSPEISRKDCQVTAIHIVVTIEVSFTITGAVCPPEVYCKNS